MPNYADISGSLCFSDSLKADEAVLSEKLWQTLIFSSQRANEEVHQRLAVALRAQEHQESNVVGRTQSPHYLILWAGHQPDSAQPDDVVKISSVRKHELPHEITGTACTISIVTPITLTAVGLVASDCSVIARVKENAKSFESWLCGQSRVVGTGQKLYCKYAGDAYEDPDSREASGENICIFEVAITEPVDRGCLALGHTQFLVTLSQSEDVISSLPPPEDGLSISPSDILSDEEQFMIDENFLASTALNGDHVGSDAYSLSGNRAWSSTMPEVFEPEALSFQPGDDWNETYSVRMETEQLGKIGLFDRDWAILTSSSNDSRLVQVRAHNQKHPSKSYTSPTFLRNCIAGSNIRSLTVRASQFSSCLPPIPTVESATLARIASPTSLGKNYQNTMIQSLKTYFESSRKLVKKGDIIAVPVWSGQTLSIEEQNDSNGVAGSDVDWIDEHSRATDVVYFLLTNLEYGVPRSYNLSTNLDAVNSTTLGELGCWIDSKISKVVQTGIENSFVPDVSAYLNIASRGLDPNFQGHSFSHTYHQLSELIAALASENVSSYGLNPTILLKGPTRAYMSDSTRDIATRLGFHIIGTSTYDILGETDSKTELLVKEKFNFAISCSPCILLLEDIDAFMQATQIEPGKELSIVPTFQECIKNLDPAWKRTGFPVVVVATTRNVDGLSAGLLSCFKHDIAFEVPNESERLMNLKSLLAGDVTASDVVLKDLAMQTAAFNDDDLADLIHLAKLCAIEQSCQILEGSEDEIATLKCSGYALSSDNFAKALDKARISLSQNIGAPSIPLVSWDDVGGLAKVKEEILDTIQLPLDHPELFADGIKQRSGVLLYGPPGTGKTLLAKAVATCCSLNFLSVKGPELLNMYIGESEANVRRVFQRAREARPCVIFFDELDSVAPKRGNQGDSGGVMDRIVSQLLAELDGISTGKGSTDVFVIGATNRPDLLDPALLRPGRFDRLLYLGVSETHEAQLAIIEALTRKFCLDPGLELVSIVQKCPLNYTGADFYALCSDAMLKAMTRKAQEIDAIIDQLNKQPSLPNHPYPLVPQYYLSEMSSPSETDIVVMQEDFERALEELVPSVSQAEMDHYTSIQKRFSQDSGRSVTK